MIDWLRPRILSDTTVQYWYRYNCFLFVAESALGTVPADWQEARIPAGAPVPDVAPAIFRMRKQIVRVLPQTGPKLIEPLNVCCAIRRDLVRWLTMRAHPDVTKGSPERFGYSWGEFNELTSQQEEQFRRWTVHLRPESDWKGKLFLDAGCGAGRNSYWAMKYGAAGGTAIDFDNRSLAAARRNLAAFPQVEVRQQSLYDLTQEGVFDICFSIGVIHHLDDPLIA